jgi:hypothetical protein
MENISNKASEYLKRVKVMKASVIEMFLNKKKLEILPKNDYFKDVLVSTTLRSITVTFYSSEKKLNFYLKSDLPGFAHSIVCYFDSIFLLAGCNHLGVPLGTVFIAKFYKSSENKLQLEYCRRSEEFSLKVKRSFCTSLLYKEQIFVFGGRNIEARDSFEVIDLKRPGSENQIRMMMRRDGFVNSCLFENLGFLVSSDSNIIEIFDLENWKRENIVTISNFSGFVFVHVVKKFKYLISCEEQIVIFDQKWNFIHSCSYDFQISWIQTYSSNEEGVIYNDFSTNQIRVISFV